MDQFDISELERKKKFLKRYKKNQSLIDRLEERLYLLDQRIIGLRGIGFSDMPKGSGSTVTTAELITDKMELEERINRLVQKGRILKKEVIEKIDTLEEPLYAEVLESFFIDGKSFIEIADEMGYNERHIIRVYSRAVNSIEL